MDWIDMDRVGHPPSVTAWAVSVRGWLAVRNASLSLLPLPLPL